MWVQGKGSLALKECPMTLFVVFVSLLLPAVAEPPDAGASIDDQPLRYRGIERLLAKFESEP